jgi:hypothetical protein
MRSIFRALLFLSLASALALSQNDSSQPRFQLSDQAARTVQELNSIGPPDDWTDVPEAARPLLTQLKHQLRDLVWQGLNAEGAQPEPSTLRRRLMADLDRVGLAASADSSGEQSSEWFTTFSDISLQQPLPGRRLVVATTRLAIPCGDDSSLYVFERGEGEPSWRLVLAVERDDYADVSGAAGSLDWKIASDPDGPWWIVVADINPWCTSNWQQLRYRALAQGASPYRPEVMLDRNAGIYLGVDESHRIDLQPGGFRVSYWADFSHENDTLTRVHLERWSKQGSHFTRVAPVALRPDDFVDEWLGTDWEEAASWSSPAAAERLKVWHERLRGRDRAPQVEFAQPCPGGTSWQIGLSQDGVGDTVRWVFTVRRSGEGYAMERIDTQRPPGCPGEAPHPDAPEQFPGP